MPISDVQKVKRSRYVRGCVAFLLALDGKTVVKRKAFVETRDVLAAMIAIYSAQRDGAIAKMSLNELKKARPENDDVTGEQFHVVAVAEHKTSRKYGCALLPLPEKVFDALNAWVKFVRPLAVGCTNEPESKVFVTLRGVSFKSGYVSKLVERTFKRCGVAFHNITMYRKTVATRFHAERPSSRGPLSRQMTHRLTTGKLSLLCSLARSG